VSVLPLFVVVRTQLFEVCAGQLLAEAAVQTPLVQVWPLPQTFPQAPQLFRSVCVLTQVFPAHKVCPLPHVHAPAVQVCPEPHAVPHVPQLLLSVAVLVQVPLQDVCPAVHALQTPDEQTPLWQLVPIVHAVPAGAPAQAPLMHGCPEGHAVAQLPQLDGSEVVVSHMPEHDLPAHGVSVSSAACILYSTSRLASAPVFEGHVEPVRSDAVRVAPAANVMTIGPLSDQNCPGVRTRSWPLVPSVKRKTAAGQPVAVAVFAEAAMRKTVIA
jgi:hypothetical protein